MKIIIVEEGQGIHIVPDSENERRIVAWFLAQRQERELDLELIGRPLNMISDAAEAIKAEPFFRVVLGRHFPVEGKPGAA